MYIDVHIYVFNLSILFFSSFLINPKTVAYISEIAMNNSLSFSIKSQLFYFLRYSDIFKGLQKRKNKKRECFGNFKINWKHG